MKTIKYLTLVLIPVLAPQHLCAGIVSTTYVDQIVSALNDTIAYKADDTDVIHRTGNETISGTKTFSDTIISTKNGINFTTPTTEIRSTDNPFYALYPNGKDDATRFYLQAVGPTMYLGPTSIRAMSFDHDTGNITAPADLTVYGRLSTNNTVPTSSNDATVATTKWTNDKITSTRSTIRHGGETSNEFVNMWIGVE